MFESLWYAATACGVLVSAGLYWRKRQQQLTAYISLRRAEAATRGDASRTYWGIDRVAKRIAVAGMLSWGLMALTMMLTKPQDWSFAFALVGMLAFVTLSMVATVFNMKETEARIKADVDQRYGNL